MAGKRKVLMIVAAAVLLVAAALALLATNIERIVQTAIERSGSKATGTAVRVGRVVLLPAQGKGSLERLTVANPPGFSAPYVLTLDAVGIRISPRAVASDPLVIDDIRVASPQVTYELNDKHISNIDVLQKKLDAGRPTGDAAGNRRSGKDREKRLRIRRLTIENAKVQVQIAAMDDRPRTISLPRIEMRDVGGKNGAPADEVAQEIVTAILSETGKQVGRYGAAVLLEKALDGVLRK